MVWKVGGEKDTFRADDLQGALKIRLAEHAAGRYVEILPHVVEDWPLQLRHPIERVQTFGVEQDDRAPVPEDDLEIRETVKDARQDEPEHLNAAFVMPAKPEGGKRSLVLRFGLDAGACAWAYDTTASFCPA